MEATLRDLNIAIAILRQQQQNLAASSMDVSVRGWAGQGLVEAERKIETVIRTIQGG